MKYSVKNKKSRIERPIEVQELSYSSAPELDQCASMLRQNRQEMFIQNLKYLLDKKGWNQKDFCREIGNIISQAQLSGILTQKTELSYQNVCRCAVFFKISPEDLLSKDLSQTEINPSDEQHEKEDKSCKKYYGTYEIAYVGTSEPTGENHNETYEALNSGIMSIYEDITDTGSRYTKVIAYFNCQPATIADIREQSVRSCDYEALYLSAAKEKEEEKYIYCGRLDLSPEIAEISLRQESGFDSVHMLLHNRAAASSAGKQYRGGLVALLSSSRGGEHMPCLQAAIVSSEPIALNWSKEEVESYLRMGPLNLDVSEEAISIYDLMSSMFSAAEGKETDLSKLNKEDKVEIIKSYIQKKLKKPISRNFLDYYKISKDMDKRVYRRICGKISSIDEN